MSVRPKSSLQNRHCLLDELRTEEALRSEPRPVLEASDIEAFRGKSEAMIRATLNALVVFPGSELIQ